MDPGYLNCKNEIKLSPASQVRLKPDEDDATMVATFAVEKAGKLPPGLGLLRIEPDSIQVSG